MKLLLLLFIAIKIKQIKTHSIKITLLHLVLIFAIKKGRYFFYLRKA